MVLQALWNRSVPRRYCGPRASLSLLAPIPQLFKDAGLTTFGSRWAIDAPYALLIFDYGYFGASDGEPRNFVSLLKQCEDYQALIRLARQRPEVFPEQC